MNDDYHDYAEVKTREDVDKLVETRVGWLKQLRTEISDDNFLQIIASVFVQSRINEIQIVEYERLIKDHEFALGVFSGKVKANAKAGQTELLKLMDEVGMAQAKALLRGLDLAKKTLAKKGAKAKLAKDPKQADKSFVKDCWLEWQRNADRYNGKAAFARDMLSKCENLISQKKIEDWCRGWEKETALS